MRTGLSPYNLPARRNQRHESPLRPHLPRPHQRSPRDLPRRPLRSALCPLDPQFRRSSPRARFRDARRLPAAGPGCRRFGDSQACAAAPARSYGSLGGATAGGRRRCQCMRSGVRSRSRGSRARHEPVARRPARNEPIIRSPAPGEPTPVEAAPRHDPFDLGDDHPRLRAMPPPRGRQASPAAAAQAQPPLAVSGVRSALRRSVDLRRHRGGALLAAAPGSRRPAAAVGDDIAAVTSLTIAG